MQDLTLEVAGGSILGMLGPNGAGKTTTLRALAGILRPTAGRLSIRGCDIAADPVAAKRQLAFVPDDPRLFDSLTVWEHLEFIAPAYRVPDFAAAAEPLLEQFELDREAEHGGAGVVAGDAAEGCYLLRLPAPAGS